MRHGSDALAPDPLEPLRQRREIRERRRRRHRRRALVRRARDVRAAVPRGRGSRRPASSPTEVEQIFEPFYTSQPGGTGLGLYISRELAERNGATLRYPPRSAVAVRFASCSPIRNAGRVKIPHETDRPRRRRRTPHLRAAVHDAAAHGHRDAHLPRHRERQAGARRASVRSVPHRHALAGRRRASSSSSGCSARCRELRSPSSLRTAASRRQCAP